MTTPWTAKYSDEQRDAVAVAIVDRELTAPEVVRRAAAGELRPGLAPFEIPANTVRDIKKTTLKRRAGDLKTGITDVPHREAVDTLRKRLLSAAELELQWVERLQRTATRLPKPERGETPVSGRLEDDAAAARRAERLRQVARAVREAAAIVVPDDRARPTKPGAHDPAAGQSTSSKSIEGPKTLAGGILAAHVADRTLAEPDTRPAPSGLPPLAHTGGGTDDRPDTSTNTTNTQQTTDRGEAASARMLAVVDAAAAGLAGGGVQQRQSVDPRIPSGGKG